MLVSFIYIRNCKAYSSIVESQDRILTELLSCFVRYCAVFISSITQSVILSMYHTNSLPLIVHSHFTCKYHALKSNHSALCFRLSYCSTTFSGSATSLISSKSSTHLVSRNSKSCHNGRASLLNSSLMPNKYCQARFALLALNVFIWLADNIIIIIDLKHNKAYHSN